MEYSWVHLYIPNTENEIQFGTFIYSNIENGTWLGTFIYIHNIENGIQFGTFMYFYA